MRGKWKKPAVAGAIDDRAARRRCSAIRKFLR
jgi:hypothetical protein